MSIRSMIEECGATFTTSDDQIASVLLADPRDLILMSAAQLAERASVHESTVTRFAQKLGFTGYPGLRRQLLDDVKEASDTQTQKVLKAAQSYELSAIIEQQMTVLADLTRHVPQETIDSAVQALLTARKVYIVGQDLARHLVIFMERKLRRYGIDVVAVEHGGNDPADRVAGLTDLDVVLVFGFGRKQCRDLAWIFRLATKRGARTILIADQAGLFVTPTPTHLLMAPRGLTHTGHLAPLVLCYALDYGIVHSASDRIRESYERLSEASEVLAADGGRLEDDPFLDHDVPNVWHAVDPGGHTSSPASH